MAANNDRITPTAFYSVVAQIHVSLYLVLMASAKGEDHWLRWFVMFYLIVLVFLWTGVLLWSLRSRGVVKDVAAAPGGGPEDGAK
jgi:hypothetical protein